MAKKIPSAKIEDAVALLENYYASNSCRISAPTAKREFGIGTYTFKKAIAKLGWNGVRGLGGGYAPSSHKKSNSKTPIKKTPSTDKNVEQETGVTSDIYYLMIRDLWYDVRAASKNPELDNLKQEILVLKEQVREHLNKVMEKL